MNLSSKSKKIIIMVFAFILTIAILGGSIFGIAYGYLNRSTIKIDFDETKEYQTFEYFGASSCWNFRVIGKEADDETKAQLVNYLYGNDGLKLTAFRYNLGGGSLELDIPTYNESTSTESFFKSENYVDNTSFYDVSNYDISKDAYYLEMLKLSLETGNIKKITIFSNSPHYLLTKNGKTHADKEHENNLPEENYEAFANYVLISSTLLDSYIKSLGYNDIEIYISPVNEPQWKWGGSSNGQEGCHYDAPLLAKFYDVFYKTMNEYNTKNNTKFVMDIYESGNYKLGLASSKNKQYLKEFSKYSYFEDLEYVSMHSYAADIDKSIRTKFYNYFKKFDKKIVMSEYCIMQGGVDPSIDTGLFSAKVLLQDLRYLNAVEWNWWLGVAFGGWEDGLVYWDKETHETNLYYRYYMYGQFMRYIDYGDVRIKADIYDLYDFGGVDSVGFKKPDGTVTIFIINDNNKLKNILLSSSKFTQATIVETYENTYWKESEKAFDGQFTIQPNSVTTIILK